jgi:tripartite-type tricarboxylate transporter receptor subunit TctC
MLEQLRLSGQADFTHVPYKGGAQQLTDAIGGQFEILSVNTSAAVLEHIRSGRFRALAQGAPSRLAELPQVPTFAELGFRDANLTSLFGIFAPGRTPRAVLDRINQEINQILATPDMRQRISAGASVPTGGSAGDFARQIADESQRNLRVVKAAGIRAE